jgi:hypothetical protein
MQYEAGRWGFHNQDLKHATYYVSLVTGTFTCAVVAAVLSFYISFFMHSVRCQWPLLGLLQSQTLLALVRVFVLRTHQRRVCLCLLLCCI